MATMCIHSASAKAHNNTHLLPVVKRVCTSAFNMLRCVKHITYIGTTAA